MSNIRINFNTHTIEITKSFEKAASRFGSDSYKELNAVRKEFPGFEVVTKTVAKKARKVNTFKGMDYNFMESYIAKHDNEAEDILNKFLDLKKKETFFEVKQWFIKTYPVFKNCKTRADWILAA